MNLFSINNTSSDVCKKLLFKQFIYKLSNSCSRLYTNEDKARKADFSCIKVGYMGQKSGHDGISQEVAHMVQEGF